MKKTLVRGIEEYLSTVNTFDGIVEAAKMWRDGLIDMIPKIKLYPYQIEFSDRLIEYVLSEGAIGNEIMAMWARQCLDGNTLIFDKNNRIQKLMDIGFKTEIKKRYKAEFTSHYNIVSSMKHRFMTSHGWKTLKELTDELDKLPYYSRSKIKIDLEPKEWIGTNIGDLAYLLGYMWSDGSNRPNQSPKFTNNKKEYLDEFEDLISKYFNDVSIKKYPKFNGYDYLVTGATRHSTSFRVWCNSNYKNLDVIEDLDKDSLVKFFNRLYSGDGWITYQGLGYGSSWLEELKLFRMLLIRLGIHSWIKPWKGNKFYTLVISHSNSIMRFFDEIGLIYGKEEACNKLINRIGKRKKYGRRSREWIRLKKVTYLDKRILYDQTVEPEGYYNAEGIIVHNSGKTETVADTVLILGTFYIIFIGKHFSTGLFAPVQSMITHVTRNRLRKRYVELSRYLERNAHLKQIAGEGLTSSNFVLKSLQTNKEFSARSLSIGDTAEIIGESFELMIVEQTELVSEIKLKNDLVPMGAQTGGVRVLTGTSSPFLRNMYFKNGVERYHSDPKRNRSTADWVKCVDYKEASKYSRKYKSYVKKELGRMGEGSIEFQTQFALKWMGLKVKFIGWEDIAGQDVRYKPDPSRLRFFGIDIAKENDSTVVCVIELDGTEIHIIAWLELQGTDYEIQVTKIAKWLMQFLPLRYGLMDTVACGAPVFDFLKAELRRLIMDEMEKEFDAVPLMEGYKEKNTEEDEMFKAMDREFNHMRVYFDTKIPRYKREMAKFLEQLLDLEREYKGRRLKLRHPKQHGKHDDFPYALALAIYALKEKSFNPGVTFVDL